MNSGRVTEFQVLHCLRGDLAYNSPAGMVKMGEISAGALVDTGNADVRTPFNAGTNVADIVGFKAGSTISATATPDYTFLANGTFLAGTATPSPNTKTNAYKKRIADNIEVYVRYSQTGTAANAGLASAWLTYYPHLDGGT